MSSQIRQKVFILVTLGEQGGAQKYIQDIASNLAGEYDITIGSGVETGDDLLTWAHEKGVKTKQFSSLKRGLAFGTLPALSDFSFFIDLVKHLLAERYDIVHLNSSKVGYLGALATFFVPNVKTIFTVHGWAYDDPTVSGRGRRWLWVAVNRFGAYFLDRIILISQSHFKSALDHHIAPPRKLYVVHNGFNPKSVAFLTHAEARARLTERRGIPANAPVVGTIANLYYTKDLKTMIAAVARMKHKDAHLVIVGGKGPQPQEELEEVAERLGVTMRVHFVGRIENAARFMKGLNAYAISSVKEGLSYTVLEAMAAGVPIISTPVGGNTEVLFRDREKPSALSAPIGNPEKFAEALDRVLDDAKLAGVLTRNAKERLAAFSYERMIVLTRWVYEL